MAYQHKVAREQVLEALRMTLQEQIVRAQVLWEQVAQEDRLRAQRVLIQRNETIKK